jgi:uncharacterized protein (TIGR03435 family)
LDTERYEVTAKFPAVTGFGEARQMLQTLLTERFQLAVRRESKEMPVYALVVGKDGFRLKETEMGAGGSSSAPGKLTATKMSLNQFAELLSGQLDRPVVDFTGIHGAYDFTLQWAPDTNANSDPGPAADIYVAIQQQLGLKLETRKAPVEMLIIEHANKAPVEN